MLRIITLFAGLHLLITLSEAGGCNWGFYYDVPLVEAKCNTCSGDCSTSDYHTSHSLQMKCSNAGATGTIYEYSDNNCTDIVHETALDISDFDCSHNSSYTSNNCDIVEMTIATYMGSNNCTGNVDTYAIFYLAEGDICAYYYGIFIEEMVSDNGIIAKFYEQNDDCTGSVADTANLTLGCYSGGGNSTLYDFVQLNEVHHIGEENSGAIET